MKTADCEELEERLRRAEQALLRSEQKAIAGRFALSVAAEVAGPLEALGNLVYLAVQDAEDAGAVRRYLQIAEGQLARISEIASRVMPLHQPEKPGRDIYLFHLIEAALRLLHREIREKRIELRLDLPSMPAVQVSETDLLHVLSTLMICSIESLPERGVLHIRTKHSKGHQHILIADNGMGIDPAREHLLFDPFAHPPEAGKRAGPKLWACKAMLEKHGGRIRHRSTVRAERSGTAFRVSLPG